MAEAAEASGVHAEPRARRWSVGDAPGLDPGAPDDVSRDLDDLDELQTERLHELARAECIARASLSPFHRRMPPLKGPLNPQRVFFARSRGDVLQPLLGS